MPGPALTSHAMAAWRPYILKQTKKFATHILKVEDVEQSAWLALVKAAKQHDARRGPFEHYAKAAIRKALISARQSEQKHWRGRALQAEGAACEVSSRPSGGEDERVEALDAQARARDIGQWCQRLPPRLRTACELLYYKDLSQRAAAALEGVTQARISQRHAELKKRACLELAALKSA